MLTMHHGGRQLAGPRWKTTPPTLVVRLAGYRLRAMRLIRRNAEVLRRGKVEQLKTRSGLRLMHFGLRIDLHSSLPVDVSIRLWAWLPLHLLLLPSWVDHRAEELYRSGSAERQGPGEVVLEVYKLDQIAD